MNSKDQMLLQKIILYCDQIVETVGRFGNSQARFADDFVYQNACAMCILQIGEMVGKLSETLTQQHPEVPWRGIKATRNIFAHSYGDLDVEITWNTIQESVPELRVACVRILENG